MDNEQLPKGYKNTEVGVIPEDWGIGSIKDLALIKTGSRNTQDKIEGGEYPFFVRSQIIERINSYSYDGEAVLTAGDGVGVGKVMHYINGKFDCHQRVYRISDFNKKISGYYFYLYFSNNFLNRIMQMTAKSSVDSVRMDMIANMQIPLPPTKAEQTAIATALSDADALINSLEKLIAKKRNIKQGAMQQLLKPKEGWEVKKLGEIAAFFKGKGLPKSHLKENGKYKCIHYGELFTKYKESISSILSYTNENENCFFSISNDVLMPTSDVTPNGLATASCIKQDGIILGGDVLVIRILPSILDGLFLSFYVSQNREKVMKLVSGSTVYHLYGSDMKDFEISYPKTEEQNEIATILSDMDNEIQALETKLEKYRKIKLGMMQNLLTGKIRLV